MKRKKALLITCLSLLGVLATTFSSVTLAKFIELRKTQQSAYGLGGERQVSIFFNPNIWKQGKDSEGNIVDANYYMYVWHSSDAEGTRTTLLPSAHVTPTISGTKMDLYVFEYDSTTLDHFLFLRWDPSIAPSADLESGPGHGKWNQTKDETYSSAFNYYCIDSWGTGDPAEATPSRNRIVKHDNVLSWAN